MSGGVDSSVTAALLLREGYDVVGISMRLGTHDTIEVDTDKPSCCSLEGIEDARRVAAQLGIPFYAVNYEANFAKYIVDYFCAEYSLGRTPNPCILCNQELKFGRLLQLSYQLETEYVATGHYARIRYASQLGRYLLLQGIDRRKDQSYALFSLTQEQLSHILMPLGEYTKSEVRKLAHELGLIIHDKPESQELCFIADNDYNRFLTERMPESIKPGPILDMQGNILGEHRGIQFYTIGQRKGLRLSLGKPVYVIKIDPTKNAVIVGAKHELLRREFRVEKLNLISHERLDEPIRAEVKIRYNDPGHSATVLQLSADEAEVQFDEPRGAVTPGQAAVFYDNDMVIGGGWIVSNGA
jgi:tRNA-specific 2-thiouridylase